MVIIVHNIYILHNDCTGCNTTQIPISDNINNNLIFCTEHADNFLISKLVFNDKHIIQIHNMCNILCFIQNLKGKVTFTSLKKIKIPVN